MHWTIFAVALVLGVFLVGCGGQQQESEDTQDGETAQSQPETTEKQEAEASAADLPEYNVTAKQEVQQGDVTAKTYSVSTDATSEEDFRQLTKHFRSENPDKDAVMISFYPNEPMAEISGGGYAFANEQAARSILGPGYSDSAIQDIMGDDGLFVISMADTLREITGGTTG